MLRITENSSLTLTASFYDVASALSAPTTARYRIDDESSGREVLGWTSLTVSTQVVIAVTADQNTLLNRTNKVEQRIITVQADHGLSSAWSDDYIYEISRLDGLN